MKIFSDFCLSSFLVFRYVVERNISWLPGVEPRYPALNHHEQQPVKSAAEVLDALENWVKEISTSENVGILLSGGIDSAILARFLPPNTKAYTIRFVAEGAIDETDQAGLYSDICGLQHKTVEVTWCDHDTLMNPLMLHKRSPLHAIEVALYKAASIARQDGVKTLIVGNGADSTFGGMDKLLARDWTLEEFITRYTFVNPREVLINTVSMDNFFSRFSTAQGFDTAGFLKIVHGAGIIQSFENAIHAAGCQVLAPYERLTLGVPLDLGRIRGGESKYILREAFSQLYPALEVPEKIPFARPMDQWLASWNGHRRKEFREDIDISRFTGDQKWLMYCLERFMNLYEEVT